MSLTSFLADLVIFVGIPLNLYVTVLLWRLSRKEPDLAVLRERAIVSTAVLLLVIVFGLVFLNNDLDVPLMSFVDTKIFTRIAMASVAILPATYWLLLYRSAPK